MFTEITRQSLLKGSSMTVENSHTSDHPPHSPLVSLKHRQPPITNSTIGQHVVLAAPTQVWSGVDGQTGGSFLHGVYHGDSRFLSGIRLGINAVAPMHVATTRAGSTSVFESAARQGDTQLLVSHTRSVRPSHLTESVSVSTDRSESVPAQIQFLLELGMCDLVVSVQGKQTAATTPFVATETDDGLRIADGRRTLTVTAAGAHIEIVEGCVVVTWQREVHATSAAAVELEIHLEDSQAVVSAYPGKAPWELPGESGNVRLDTWVRRASDDLAALLLYDPHSGSGYLAAGAPWFFTLFGRDSLIAARFLVPFGTEIAWQTLHTLAARQGHKVDIETAEQPGKIMHELRATQVEFSDGTLSLPPVYYGTIDATPLWVILLHQVWRADGDLERLRGLCAPLTAALEWMRDYGVPDGSGFLKYIDESGRGLANQGWKDSDDSVRFGDGSQAVGPIALSEVQAQACQAAWMGADLLDALGEPGSDQWREWADDLRLRFRESFWVERDGYRFPAIALDGGGRRVDSLTSNIGQLIGTGLLNSQEEREIVNLLVSDRLLSGFGIRTMAEGEGGYWPQSYHCGTVWAHDTAIAIEGLLAAGFDDEAKLIADQLLSAAEAFDYRMPELHSGRGRDALHNAPAPFLNACRPQAWSAAAAVPVYQALNC